MPGTSLLSLGVLLFRRHCRGLSASHRLRRDNPQGWSRRSAGDLNRMNQLITSVLLKSGVIDFSYIR